MIQIKQEFVYGFSLPKESGVDVVQFCAKYELDYVCPGEYAGGSDVVVGLKVPLHTTTGDETMGKGKLQLFSLEAFLQAYHVTRVALSGERVRHIIEEMPELEQWLTEPHLWTVSHRA